MANVRLKILHGRSFKRSDGSEGKAWTQVGTAWMNDKGIEGEVFYIPASPDDRGRGFSFIMREDDGRPAQEGGGYRGEQGGRERVAQGFQQARPQAPQGGPQQPGLRPQHRDGLSGQGGGQGALYGGAAARQRSPGDDDVPDPDPFNDDPNDAIPF